MGSKVKVEKLKTARGYTSLLLIININNKIQPLGQIIRY